MLDSLGDLGLIPPPSVSEADALAVAARYLGRAGNHAASRLLGGGWVVASDAVLWEALRDNLLAGAALCDGLHDLHDSAGGLTGPPAGPAAVSDHHHWT